MSLADRQLFLCSCNGTQPLDAAAIGRALDLAAAPTLHTMLCQKEMPAFADGARGDVLVACTQEARLFEEVASEGARTQAIRFVNLRESGGWSPQARGATPKLAALIAAAALPEPRAGPAGRATAREGQVLVVGPLDAAMSWASTLATSLAVTVLATGRTRGRVAAVRARVPDPERPARLARRAGSARSRRAGRRTTRSTSTPARAATPASAPVPRTRSTRATRSTSTRCQSHRACVVACGDVRRDRLLPRRPRARGGRFDLVLDLRASP